MLIINYYNIVIQLLWKIVIFIRLNRLVITCPHHQTPKLQEATTEAIRITWLVAILEPFISWNSIKSSTRLMTPIDCDNDCLLICWRNTSPSFLAGRCIPMIFTRSPTFSNGVILGTNFQFCFQFLVCAACGCQWGNYVARDNQLMTLSFTPIIFVRSIVVVLVHDESRFPPHHLASLICRSAASQ